MSRLVLLLLALTCSTSWAQAEDARKFSQEQLAFFETKIRPVLVEQCLACHSNDDKQKGGLSLTSRTGLLSGGESGPAIVPGKPDASLLLEALRYESYEMPPKGKLPDRIIDDFAKWIAMGAPDPRVESAPAKKADHAIDAPQLWSLQPLSVVEPPQVDGVSDPIGRFIRGRLRPLAPAESRPAGSHRGCGAGSGEPDRACGSCWSRRVRGRCGSQAAGAERPNIVYIIADDHVWTDFGFMGNERVHTPNLDRLAAQSARFTNGYVPSSVCRPSLVSLLTGLYPHQHGVHFNHGPPGSAGYNRITSADAYVTTRQLNPDYPKTTPKGGTGRGIYDEADCFSRQPA